MHAISTITCRLDVEAGHLEVDPHQPVVDVRDVGARSAARSDRTRGTLAASACARVDSRADGCSCQIVWRPTPTLLRGEQRRAVHGRPRASPTSPTLRRPLDRRARMVLGRGRPLPRHRVLDAVRRRCSTRRDGIPWATWFTGGRCNLAARASTAGPTTRDGATAPRSSGRARKATTRTLTWRELRDAHRPHRVGPRGARRGARRRGRALPADGPGDGRRAVRRREARRDLPADLLRLRRRRGRGPARGRATRTRSITADGFTRRGQVGADEGDRRRGGRAGRRRCRRWSSCRASVATTCR